MSLALVPLEGDAPTSFGRCGHVLVVCAHDQESDRSFALFERHVRTIRRLHGTAAFLFVVEHQKGPPPGFVERAREVLVRSGDSVSVASTALLAEGFVASVYRSMGTMIIAMIGRRDTFGVHASIEAACAWLCPRLAPGPSAPDAAALAGAARQLLRGGAATR